MANATEKPLSDTDVTNATDKCLRLIERDHCLIIESTKYVLFRERNEDKAMF